MYIIGFALCLIMVLAAINKNTKPITAIGMILMRFVWFIAIAFVKDK